MPLLLLDATDMREWLNYELMHQHNYKLILKVSNIKTNLSTEFESVVSPVSRSQFLKSQLNKTIAVPLNYFASQAELHQYMVNLVISPQWDNLFSWSSVKAGVSFEPSEHTKLRLHLYCILPPTKYFHCVAVIQLLLCATSGQGSNSTCPKLLKMCNTTLGRIFFFPMIHLAPSLCLRNKTAELEAEKVIKLGRAVTFDLSAMRNSLPDKFYY